MGVVSAYRLTVSPTLTSLHQLHWPLFNISSKPCSFIYSGFWICSPFSWKLVGLGGFLGDSVVKNLPASTGDMGSIPVSGITPAEGNDNPLQYSCLENPMDGGAWWAPVHGITKSRTRLSNYTHSITLQYCSGFCHTCTWISHGCTCVPILNPSPTSLPISSHQPWAPCLMHQTWTGDLFHIW